MPSFGSMVIFTTLPSSLKNKLNFSGPMSTFLSVFSTGARPGIGAYASPVWVPDTTMSA